MRSRTEKYSSIILIINSTFLITSHNDILLIKEQFYLPTFAVDFYNFFWIRFYIVCKQCF